jgi:hypothetical protein
LVEISWMAKLIVEQQDMSVDTLANMRERGVREDETMLRLDFHYDAPGQREAGDLAAFLRQSTDYTIVVERGPRQGMRRGRQVSGQTQDTTITSEMIDDWIRWMVLAGAAHGECRFDGWGAWISR